jgi:hypothetical protein
VWLGVGSTFWRFEGGDEVAESGAARFRGELVFPAGCCWGGGVPCLRLDPGSAKPRDGVGEAGGVSMLAGCRILVERRVSPHLMVSIL